MQDVEIIGLLKTYVKKSLVGVGALKGANCQIQSVTDITGGKRVTFLWYDTNNVAQTTDVDLMDGDDGKGISSVDIDANGHLIITYTDDTTHDAGEIPVDIALSEVSDVNITTPTDGQILKYDTASSKWINATIPAIESLGDIDDVTISGATADQILVYDGTNWVNRNNEVVADINDLTDVDITTPTNGQILIYDSTTSTWKNGSPGATSTTIEDLADVTVTAIQDGQVLKWDAANSVWINAAGGGDIEALSDIGDVNITAIADGQILKWDAASSKWVNAEAANPTQVSTMPTAADHPQEVLQYVGDTTADYTRGYFYYSEPSVVSGSIVYNWAQIAVQPSNDDYENMQNLPQINSVELTGNKSLDDLTIQEKMQYSTMPTASADNLGDVVEYIGSTTADYTLGYFYQCQYVNSAYSWVKIDISDNAALDARIDTLEDNQGNMSSLEISSVSDIVAALNVLNARKLSSITYAEPILTLTYADTSTITFNVRDSILSETQLGELANVNDATIANGNILQYDSAIVGYKPYDIATTLTNLLQSAKDYTDEEIASSVTDDAFVCDAKPTCAYDSTSAAYIVVYYQNSVVHTTTDTTARFYYKVDGDPYCTSWFVTGDVSTDPVEYTYLLSSPDFDDYVSKSTDVVSTYTEDMVDKDKIPDIAAMDALLAVVKTLLALKVNTADIVDNLLSTSTTVPLSANQGKVLKDLIDTKQNTMQMATMPTASVDYVGVIYQYTGTTSAAYKQGSFYIGSYDSDTDVYSWQEIEFAPDIEEITAAEVDALWV